MGSTKLTKTLSTAGCLTMLFNTGSVPAQAPGILWEKTYGGSDNDGMQQGTKTIQASDGGFIAVGFTESSNGDVTGVHSNRDIWIVKTNSSGAILWQKSYGGSNKDYARSVDQTADGGFVVVGVTESNDGDVTGNHGNADMWVLKLNSSGLLQWQKTFGGAANDFANSVHQTPDGAYIIFGTTLSTTATSFQSLSDYWAVKTDASGNVQWEKAYGGTGIEEGAAIQLTSDGGYALSGFAESADRDVVTNHGSSDYWLVKINGTGSLQWQKTYGGSNEDRASDVKQTSDGGYIMAGHTLSTDGDITFKQANTDYWVIKTDNTGAIQWQKTYGGNSEDYALALNSTLDGGYIIAGYTLSTADDVTCNHGASDAWIIKTTNAGVLQWQKTLGGSDNDIAFGIQQTADGGYIVSQQSSSNDGDVSINHGSYDFWLVKLAPNCNLSVSVGSDETLYFGYAQEQCKLKLATVSGGTGSFSFIWSLNRPLLTNVITPEGDEVLTGINTNTVNICLLDTAILCVSVTDIAGCTATDCATIFAEDVRCFAGNSGNQKVKVCHKGKLVCVDENAVESHLNHGDAIGSCTAGRMNDIALPESTLRPAFLTYSTAGTLRISARINLENDQKKNAYLKISNMNGQLISRVPVGEKLVFDIQVGTKGIFIVQLVTNKGVVTKRLLVQ